MGVVYPPANKCLFADIFFFTVGEGDKAMFPSFVAEYARVFLIPLVSRYKE